MAVIPVILRVLAEKSSEFAGVINDVRSSFGSIAESIDAARIKAIGFTSILSTGLTGIAGLAVHQAGEFEQLQAKLISVTGSTEKASAAFSNAVKVAAASPFDVKGIVAATATLEAFGQRSQEVLPLAANLAAAFGASAQEGALTLGKAFAGSLEGFESLRSTYGISNLELRKFGAELTKTGGIAITTSSGLAKARDALTQIINTKYGDAIARQSDTLFGAFSNLQDAISRVAASFGNTLIPVVNAGTRVITGVIEKFEQMPQGLREIIVAMGIVVAGFSAFTAAALSMVGVLGLAIGPLLVLGRAVAGLRLISIIVPPVLAFARTFSLFSAASVAATSVLSLGRAVSSLSLVARLLVPLQGFARVLGLIGSATGITGPLFTMASAITAVGKAAATAAGVQNLAQGLAAVRVAAAGFLGIGLGPALLVMGTAVGGLFTALQAYKNETEQTNQEILTQTNSLRDSNAEFRNLKKVLSELTGKQSEFVDNAGAVADVAKGVAESLKGLTPLELQKRLKDLGISAEDFAGKLKENRAEAEKTKKEIDKLSGAIAEYQSAMDSREGSSDPGEQLQFRAAQAAIEKAKESLKTFKQDYAQLGGDKAILDGVIDATKQADKSFADAALSSKRLGSFIQEATKSDNVADLAGSLSIVNERLGSVKAAYAATGLPVDNLVALQQQLLTATDEQIPAIKEIIGLLEAQEGLTKKLASAEGAQVKERIRQADLAIERENQLKGEDLSRERKRVADELSLVKAGTEEELAIRRRLATLDGQLRTQRVAKAKTSFEEEQLALKANLDSLRSTGNATADEVAGAIEQIIIKTEAWEAANKTLLSSDAGLRKQVSTTLVGLRKDLDTATQAIPKEKLDNAINAAKDFSTEAITAEQRLAAASQALASLRQLQDSGAITTSKERTRLQLEINKYTGEELKLKQEVTKEERAQARETAGLKRGGLETELELLKAKQDLTGKDQSFAIRQKEQQIVAERVQAIRDQEQAEIDSGVNAVRAHENAEIRITQLKNEETLKRIKLDQDATKSVDDEAKQQQAILDQFQQNRQGGQFSPLKSLSEVGFDLSSIGLGDFSLGGFGLGGGRGRGQQVPSGLSNFQQSVERDIRSGDQMAGRGDKNRFTAQINENERERNRLSGEGMPGNVTNIYLTLKAETFDVKDPKTKQNIRELVDEYATEGAHRGVA